MLFRSWIGEETHAEAMGLSHIQDLRPRDSGCRLAPLTCGSHDLESRFLAERDPRCATNPDCRFGDEVRAPEFRSRAFVPTGMANRTLTARLGACRSHERWIQAKLEVLQSVRTERLSAAAERFIACATWPASGRFK